MSFVNLMRTVKFVKASRMRLGILQILVIFTITLGLEQTSFRCPLDVKLCKCTQKGATDFTLSCENVLVWIKQNDFLVLKCKKMVKDYFDEIPTLNTSSIRQLLVGNCSMPFNESLNYFVNKFNMTNLEFLKFNSRGANAGRTIASNIFEGLQNNPSINFTSNDEKIKFLSDLITISNSTTINMNQMKFQVYLTQNTVTLNCKIGEHQNVTLFPNISVLNKNIYALQIINCNVDNSLNNIVKMLNLQKIKDLWLSDVNMMTNYSSDNFQQLEYLKSLNIQSTATQYFSLEFIQNLHNLQKIELKNLNLNSSDFTQFNFLDNLQIMNNGTLASITTDTNTIEIDCTNAVYKELDNLMHIKLGNQTNLIITECSIPYNKTLIFIKDFFSINQLLSLEIESNGANVGRQFTSKLFEGFNELQELSIECNDIHEIPNDLFKHLTNVRKINLNIHQDAKIPQDIFVLNLNLKSMSMTKDGLVFSTTSNHSLDIACFSELKMDFSWIPTFDYGIITEILMTDCELPQNKSIQQVFHSLNLEHVKVLKVDCLQFHNQSPHFEIEQFQDFKLLENLSMDCPGLKNIVQGDLKHLTNLKNLKLNIKNLDVPVNISSIALYIKNLELFTDSIQIWISFNSNVKLICNSNTEDYINDIPTLIIEGDVKDFAISECSLPHNNSLAILKNKFNIKNLSNLIIRSKDINKQRTLSSAHFAGFEDLPSLLIDMEVMNATEDAFKYLPNLTLLEMTLNIALTPRSFSYFKNLRYFHINNSSLTMIPGNFLSSKKVTDFAIIDNEVALESINVNLFLQQPNLNYVTIKNCSLKTIPEDIFKTNLRLVSFDLSLNRIEVLPKDIFRNQMLLGFIDLSGNLIFELHHDVFSSINTLFTLRLSNNKLTKIPEYVQPLNYN